MKKILNSNAIKIKYNKKILIVNIILYFLANSSKFSSNLFRFKQSNE